MSLVSVVNGKDIQRIIEGQRIIMQKNNPYNMKKVFILGGYQTDFAINYKRAGKDFYDLLQDSVIGAFEQTDIAPKEVKSIQ